MPYLYSNRNNPIKYVKEKGASDTTRIVPPCPTAYVWTKSDVSASSAGRTEDGLMHKNKITDKVKLELEWINISQDVASDIASIFSYEYLTVEYWDIGEKAYVIKNFYTGDRTSTMLSMGLKLQSSFTISLIEQ